MAGRQKTVHAAVAKKKEVVVAKKPITKKLLKKTHQKAKTIKIKHHHAKAYRKRHVSALFLFIILSSVLITWLLIYREQVGHSLDGAQNYISEVFNPATVSTQTVSSTLGFSVSYDIRTFTASAIDSATGDLFIGQELGVNRAYQTVRIFTGNSDITKNSQRSLTINYYDNLPVAELTDGALIQQEKTVAENGVDTSKAQVRMLSSTTENINGTLFRASEWKVQQASTSSIASKVAVGFRTYAGVVHGKAMIMKVTYGISGGQNGEIFKSVISSMTFSGRKQAQAKASKVVADKISSNRSLIDTVLFTRMASAATALDSSEEISSRFSPTVVKIYNLYCMDIAVDGTAYSKDTCEGSTGSGFFINGDGYIGTNGHVASADPLDIVINNAIQNLVNGDQTNFNYLANVAGVRDTDFSGKESTNEIIDIAVNKMYQINPARITTTNAVYNLMVGINEKQPNIGEMIKDTQNRQVYAEQSGVKKAKLVAKDYRVVDGIIVNGAASFKASDVAIIKIDGSDYPVAHLGSLSAVSQGAGLLILGYPGEASDNGLVDASVSKPTLTAGKVSSIKTVSGSTKQLIETDATIGHGNSGGPVFDESGDVIGIATYTIDGSGQGNGTYNYIRDIQDLKDLAADNNVSINGTSATQKEWNKGIDLFYNAHYSKAVQSFVKVQELYPQHPKASDLIAAANERIANGQEVKDFPYVVVATAIVSVLGIVVSAFVILRHHRKHKVYVAQVANGTIQPMQKGDRPHRLRYIGGGEPMEPVAPAAEPAEETEKPEEVAESEQPKQTAKRPPRKVQF
ncbi:MAG: hypothetical protein JWO47_889 [Candidatus Saccharibacteria bacterium]|nr:hypothetical protein [Candidatus Saccharibacteria bacterium]